MQGAIPRECMRYHSVRKKQWYGTFDFDCRQQYFDPQPENEIMAASCVLCTSLSLDMNRSKFRFTTRDEARNHAILHLSQMKNFDVENCQSLDLVFEQCFPNFGVTRVKIQKKVVVKKEGRQSLLNVCHALFKGRISEASPRVTCQKCGSSIFLYGGKKRGVFGVAINHASSHLGIDLFECRKCGRSFGNKSALCNHLRFTHRLRCLSEYFTDKSGDYIDEIINSIQQCFSEGNNRPSDEKARTIRRQSLSNVCRTVFNRRISKASPRVTCQKCGSGILLYRGGPLFGVAINHASSHLGIDLFECRQCGRSFGNKGALCNHLRLTHRLGYLSEYFTDKSGDYIDEIINSIEQCFSEGNNGPSDEKASKIRRRSLLDVCHAVFKGRISKASPRVTCQKCGAEIVSYGYGEYGGRQFRTAINHASIHLGIGLFECRKCERSFSVKSALVSHLMSSHNLRCLSEHFTDKSSDFMEEITNSIEQCFTECDNGPSVGKAPMIRLKNKFRLRSMTNGSKLAMERQLLCSRLTRQVVGDDGKVQCRLCPKRINIKHDGSCKVQRAMEHAHLHLKKPLFRCKICSNVRYSRTTMVVHLKSTHALPLFMNYECLADEFHADVLDMLQKCYSEEQGK